MTTEQSAILNLIKSGIKQKKINLTGDLDWQVVREISYMHQVDVMLYYGCIFSEIKMPDEISNQLKNSVYVKVYADMKQSYEIERITKLFKDNQIEHLFLKGAVLKSLYPKTEMRFMADIDILIKQEQYEIISRLLEKLGYRFNFESNHEYIWGNKNVCLELHKHLIPTYNIDFDEYYGDSWKFAKSDNGIVYEMSDEDFYVYLLTHLAKHYRDSGIGIKNFVDLYVFRENKHQLDFKYINKQLDQLHLLEFHDNCVKTLNYWFDGGDNDENIDIMTKWVFESGVFGTSEKQECSMVIKKTQQVKNWKAKKILVTLKKIFPELSVMKNKYKCLERFSFLLPAMWFVRIVDVFINKRKRIAQETKMIKEINIKKYDYLLRKVGLNYDKWAE